MLVQIDTGELRRRDPHRLLKQNCAEVLHKSPRESLVVIAVVNLQDLSWKAQVRLCKRYRQLIARGQQANQVGVAVAREWVGFIWAIAKQVDVKP